MLRIEMRQIWDQVFHDRHMRQRIDLHVTLDLIHAIDARQRVHPINIHRTGATNSLSAGSTEGKRRINFTFDLDQSIQNHRAAGVHIHEISVNLWGFSVIRVPTINLENPQVSRPFRFRPGLPRVMREFFGSVSCTILFLHRAGADSAVQPINKRPQRYHRVIC